MFTGFTEETLRFLRDIRMNNFNQYYEENRERYEREVKAPLRALSDELAPVMNLIDPKLDTRPARTMSRIRRDTRFTKDKSPFRDHIWLGWRYPGEAKSEGFGIYWGLGPEWQCRGCGSYAPDKPTMDALRRMIRREPEEAEAILCDRKLMSRFRLLGEDYKKLAVPETVPESLRPFYRKRTFDLEAIALQTDWVTAQSHALVDRLTEDFMLVAPVYRLMRRLRAQGISEREEERLEREAAQKDGAGLASARSGAVRTMEEFEF